MRIIKYLSFLLVSAFILWYFIGHKKEYQIISGETFGTYYNIKIKSSEDNTHLQKLIKDEFEKINMQMSVFNTNSEISNINRELAGQWIDLSPEMAFVMKNAYQFYKQSDGAFDPTVGRLIDLWGFGTKGSVEKEPDKDEIAQILKTTGFDKVSFDAKYEKIRKNNDKTIINLSAIAKGYGVDRIAKLLKEQGLKNFVIEVGGEVYASGKKSETIDGWNVGIVNPQNDNEVNAFVVKLKNFAAATSGDYRNFFYVDGKKYSHTIDPKTGYPAENSLLSVTVFDKSCMRADALATAIMSMGEKKSYNFIKQLNLPVVLFMKDESGNLQSWISDAAKNLGVK